MAPTEPTEPASVIRDAQEANSDSLNMDVMRQMANLYIKKRDEEAALKETKAAIAGLQEVCLSELAMAGVERLPLTTESGSITLYIHSQMWARPIGGSEGRAAVVDALNSEGMEGFVKTDVNLNQISGFVRECNRSGVELPERLRAVLDLSTTTELRARVS